jgi:hypothetical protein
MTPPQDYCSTEIEAHFPGKLAGQIWERWKKVLDPQNVKGCWSREEDEAIVQWVREHGPTGWSALAVNLPGRIGKQCRERWCNSLDPDVDHDKWTAAEDTILIHQHERLGNKWSQIASFLPGRTDNGVKNRWNSSLKRRLERRAKGEPEVIKRGRKPKRQSEARWPSRVFKEFPMPILDDIDSAEVSLPPPLVVISPVLSVESNQEDVGVAVREEPAAEELAEPPLVVSLILPSDWEFDEEEMETGQVPLGEESWRPSPSPGAETRSPAPVMSGGWDRQGFGLSLATTSLFVMGTGRPATPGSN